jgi:hypothetical protein
MKKMKITENELITLIEKIVNEQGVAFGGFGENMGVSKPTDKYKDLNLEGEDIEDEVEEDVYESEIVERLRKRMGPQKFPKKVSETINEQRSVTRWTREEIDNVTDMVTEIYNDMVERRDVAPPEGPQG